MDKFSFLGHANAAFVEDLYEQYLENPDAIASSWRSFFQGYDFALQQYDSDGDTTVETQAQLASNVAVSDNIRKEFQVIQLIDDYRKRGHLFTKTNPVRERRKYSPDLSKENFGLFDQDLDTVFSAGEVLGIGPKPLREIIRHLEVAYCQSIGVEYMYIRQPKIIKWIQDWLNVSENKPTFKPEQKKQIFRKLNQAVGFENFLHTKFVGQKRFSLEGNESLIPALDAVIERGANKGVKEFVVGMAHRGRLSVLANIFGKTYSQIFSEFEKKDYEEEDPLFDGDVKYHLGSTVETTTDSGKKIKMNLAPNPSHLETVDAIVEGITRAKIDKEYNGNYSEVMPILIHGDAAVAGQGIVYEVVQMMSLDGYKTGGTIHIVVNNQIGFTTNYLDARSSTYCTDIAKVTLSPVLHVNADDAEAVVHALSFAVDFRMQFGLDVFIDLLGYRKYGHNEGDEPKFTQPNLYKAIAKHPNPRDIYFEKLQQEGAMSEVELQELKSSFKTSLEGFFEASKKIEKNTLEPFMGQLWENYITATIEDLFSPIDTTFSVKKLEKITDVLTTIPSGNKFLRKIERLLSSRKKMTQDGTIDWGMAELLAYGSLVEEGFDVRLSGEDVERGTFSHRHAVTKDENTEEEVILLNHISKDQGKFEVFNSHLSEYGVLGFDYGYAMTSPKTLTIWEAQFGDFSNGAQIVIDQYISAAEDKWKTKNGLVMLLPHGYEGQGAEHSSARLERYLQLCGQFNMFVANCTTPANFYHLLRRQMKANFRKPLIVMTPKSLLRHPKCVSSIDELAKGKFEVLIDDATAEPNKVERVAFCSGKLYYELLAKKEELNDEKVALVRLEQLYPLPISQIDELLKKYTQHTQVYWVQEEPRNMGAWSHILRRLRHINFELISPNSSASPAAGTAYRWAKRQQRVIDQTFEF